MRKDIDKYEKIEKYLKNELSKEERRAFEHELSLNDDLVKEVKKHQAIHELIVDHALLELKGKMQQIEQNLKHGKGKTGSSFFFKY